jgi:FAD:protein FMN transferase
MLTLRFACHAMATRFEVVLLGDDGVHLRSVAEEALAEISRTERRFSFYDSKSELAAINRRAGYEPVRVAPDLFGLIEYSLDIARLSGGAFDPTVAPLMRCWGFVCGPGSLPDQDSLSDAKKLSGYEHVILHPGDSSVSFNLKEMELDLGGIAKGFAVDAAADIIKESGLGRALIHGGTSTVFGIGTGTDSEPWRVGICSGEDRVHGSVSVENHAFSVSATGGKSFTHGDTEYGHVIDPGSGSPVRGTTLAAVAAPTATAADALSTAALVLGSRSSIIEDSCLGWAVLKETTTGREAVMEQHGLPGYRTFS